MHFSSYLTTVAALAVPSLQAPQAGSDQVVERLISQRFASYNGIMTNIGGSGKSEANAPGASPGLVVASPTKENPKSVTS